MRPPIATRADTEVGLRERLDSRLLSALPGAKLGLVIDGRHFSSLSEGLSMKRTMACLGTLAILTGSLTARAKAELVNVDGKSGPWEYNGGLNTSFQYGVGDQQPPTIVTSVAGINLVPAQTLKLVYQSGAVSGGVGLPFFDAGGDPSQPNPPPTGNGRFPSFYMSSSNPINYVELVGTFADNQGRIVGSPFPVGDGPTVLTVPSGAIQLQLGVNDNLFSDNSGSWVVSISSVPEPSTLSVYGWAAGLPVGLAK
jgi:hypothetical protein